MVGDFGSLQSHSAENNALIVRGPGNRERTADAQASLLLTLGLFPHYCKNSLCSLSAFLSIFQSYYCAILLAKAI